MMERHGKAGQTPIELIAHALGATAADIPGLWNLPGFPELTTNQLRSLHRPIERDHLPLELKGAIHFPKI